MKIIKIDPNSIKWTNRKRKYQMIYDAIAGMEADEARRIELDVPANISSNINHYSVTHFPDFKIRMTKGDKHGKVWFMKKVRRKT